LNLIFRQTASNSAKQQRIITMRMNIENPITKPVTIRVTFNGTEVLKQDFAVGDTPAVEWNPPPKTSGVVQLYQIVDGKEIPSGSATYWAPDFKGAQMLVEEAKQLQNAKKPWQARTKLLAAVKIFEKLAPDNDDLADAYTCLWNICFQAKARPGNVLRRQKEGLEWFEKAIAIFKRTGNQGKLGGALINISFTYARAGDSKTALSRADAALAIFRTRNNDEEAGDTIIAWALTIRHLLTLSRWHEAESLIGEGLARFGENPMRAYFFNQLAQVYTERAKICKQTAEQLLPPGACLL
jgi:tetratricopeptide (TPR) repeat protein